MVFLIPYLNCDSVEKIQFSTIDSIQRFSAHSPKKNKKNKKKKVAPGNKLSWRRKVVVHLFLFSSPKIEWTSNRFKSQRREPTASKSSIKLHTMKVSKGGSCLFRRSVTGFCFFLAPNLKTGEVGGVVK